MTSFIGCTFEHHVMGLMPWCQGSRATVTIDRRAPPVGQDVPMRSRARISSTAIGLAVLAALASLIADHTASAAVAQGPELATTVLARIKVENEHKGGYDRALFEHWADVDGDGCDSREQVLRDESTDKPQVDPYRCKVIAGHWRSAYDGVESDDPTDFDIDHVVALKEAWDSGAWAWPSERRKAYANDTSDPRTLRAVSASSNRTKSDKDPSNWVPPDKSMLCTYLSDWISIKARWGLSMDPSEAGYIRKQLRARCATATIAPWPPVTVLMSSSAPNSPAATSAASAATTPRTTSAAAPATRAPSAETTTYANCAAVRAAGAAPLHRGDPGYSTRLDRDGDGVACE